MASGIGGVNILGAGPAGTSAALAAMAEGAAVTLVDRSRFPRHKVCGEFFSPEVALELDRAGAWSAFLAAGPSRIQRLALHFGTRTKISRLPDTAWGLSRYAFDSLLLDQARSRGALLIREAPARIHVLASGRPGSRSARGKRLFGFKAHFEGPSDDAVELFFFNGAYVGVNTVENGRTNVCGLAPEDALAKFNFDYDAFTRQCPALSERLAPLRRSMQWLSVGPLEYQQSFAADGAFLAGDALSFVDPFTGSGLLAAIRTGTLAGRAAAQGVPLHLHQSACRAILKKPFLVSSVLRRIVQQRWADPLIAMVPGRMLFAVTRPL